MLFLPAAQHAIICVLVLLCLHHTAAFSASFVETPLTDLPYNFGPASDRDNILYTCHRPGNGSYDDTAESPTIDTATARTQIAWMHDQGVRHALILLDANELAEYATSNGCDGGLPQLYTDGGIVPHVQPMGEPEAAQTILQVIRDVETSSNVADAKVVAHCTGGKGRAGRVAAAWVAARYGVSPQAATDDVIGVAEAQGINRVGAADKLASWLGDAAIEIQ